MPETFAPSAELSADDLARCREILRAGSKSFDAAGRLLPPRLRGPIAALYAFCRVADDDVDLVAAGGRAAAVDALAARLDAAYLGRPADHAVDRAFSAIVRGYRIPRAIPDALIEGFRWDVEGRRYETFGDVCAYAARVASTVGVMMTLLIGERSALVLSRAADLGIAMQLTNIARDVGEDARDGRVYLPVAWLREAGLSADALVSAPRASDALRGVVRRLLSRADALYARADGGLSLLPADARVAMTAARLVYADIGREIAAADFDSVSRRASTTTARKAALLALAPLRGVLPRAVSHAPTEPEAAFLVDAVLRADADARW